MEGSDVDPTHSQVFEDWPDFLNLTFPSLVCCEHLDLYITILHDTRSIVKQMQFSPFARSA